VNKRIYPVGRLDYDTTGVLLLTNDGELANKLTHPSNEIDKVYIATIKGEITKEDIEKLENGVEFDGKTSSPCKAVLNKYNKDKDKSIVELTIHEGRNHQVKKMFEAIGKEVIKLHRDSFAGISSKGLYEGQSRKLTDAELKELKKLTNKDK
jgi:23S rRNA pseudouridine2605 synthase